MPKAEDKTWAQMFPHPGEQPPEAGEEPGFNERDAWNKWQRTRMDYEKWVGNLRRHTIAKAVDELDGKPIGDMKPADRIALLVGVMLLDGRGMPSSFFSMFGL